MASAWYRCGRKSRGSVSPAAMCMYVCMYVCAMCGNGSLLCQRVQGLDQGRWRGEAVCSLHTGLDDVGGVGVDSDEHLQRLVGVDCLLQLLLQPHHLLAHVKLDL